MANEIKNKLISAESLKVAYDDLKNKKYSKPSTGIPESDLSDGVKEKLNNIYNDAELRTEVNKKYAKPGTGIPESDLSADVKEKLNKDSDLNLEVEGNPEEITFVEKDDFDSLKNDINVVKGRMDTFTSLPSGSTTGDAELIDIRVGADGIVYNNAGDAVRSQINGLNEYLSILGERTNQLFDISKCDFKTFYFSGGKVANLATAKSIIIPINISSGNIHIHKEILTGRFYAGTFVDYPTVGAVPSHYTSSSNNDISVAVEENDRYLMVWFWLQSVDAAINPYSVLEKMMIEEGHLFTGYQKYYGTYKKEIIDSLASLFNNFDSNVHNTILNLTHNIDLQNKDINNANMIIIFGNNHVIDISMTNFNNCSNIKFIGCQFIGHDFVARGAKFENCKNFEFIDCTFDFSGYSSNAYNQTGCKNGIYFVNSSFIYFKNCIVKNTSDRYGIIFEGCSNCNVEKTYFEHIGGAGVEISHSNENITVRDNKFIDCCMKDLGDEVSGASDGVIDTYGAKETGQKNNVHIFIENNEVNGYGFEGRAYSGIRLSGTSDSHVIGNIVKNNYANTFCLMIQDRNGNVSRRNTVSNNYFECGLRDKLAYIKMQQSGEVYFTGNQLVCNVSTNNARLILMTDATASCIISNNTIGGMGNAYGEGINIYGQNHIVSGNIIKTHSTAIRAENASKIVVNNNFIIASDTNNQMNFQNCIGLYVHNNTYARNSGFIYIRNNTDEHIENNIKWE